MFCLVWLSQKNTVKICLEVSDYEVWYQLRLSEMQMGAIILWSCCVIQALSLSGGTIVFSFFSLSILPLMFCTVCEQKDSSIRICSCYLPEFVYVSLLFIQFYCWIVVFVVNLLYTFTLYQWLCLLTPLPVRQCCTWKIILKYFIQWNNQIGHALEL